VTWCGSATAVLLEPVFGQIEDCRGIRRFWRRGEDAAHSGWKLIAGTHTVGALPASTPRSLVGTCSRTATALAT
jgi:hypothetical protein